MSYPVTRVTVKDTPPPRPVISVGRIYPIPNQVEPETVFRTVDPDEDDVERWEDGESETKVVRRRGRRPQPKSNEDAETK